MPSAASSPRDAARRRTCGHSAWVAEGRLDLIGIFDRDGSAQAVGAEVRKLAGRWLGDLERRLQGREWVACEDFTVADIMMAGVLRSIRKADLMVSFPAVTSYYARCQARPAWQRTLALYAERMGLGIDDIR